MSTKNILFICSQNKLRSPTAETIFFGLEGFDVYSAGLDKDAKITVTPELLEWAEILFVMEKNHRNRLLKRFKKFIKNQRLICLDIPDDYEYMDEELIFLLREKVPRHLGIYSDR